MNVRLLLAVAVVLLSIVGLLWFIDDADHVGTAPSANVGPEVTFTPSANKVEAFDFLEVTLGVRNPSAKNPFTDVSISGRFQREGGDVTTVEGFCDATDGRTYRIRFMPSEAGKYSYDVSLRQGDIIRKHSGKFEATAGRRRGVLRVDKKHPWHFAWEGTGEHYFLNGNTAFLLMGWQNERVIREALDRQHRLKVNRLRVLLGGGRSSSF
jgi:hypothetical protein